MSKSPIRQSQPSPTRLPNSNYYGGTFAKKEGTMMQTATNE